MSKCQFWVCLVEWVFCSWISDSSLIIWHIWPMLELRVSLKVGGWTSGSQCVLLLRKGSLLCWRLEHGAKERTGIGDVFKSVLRE